MEIWWNELTLVSLILVELGFVLYEEKPQA